MLIGLVEFIDTLGLPFYATVWMLILGGASVGGFYTRISGHKGKARIPWAGEIFLAWFMGILVFFNTTANFAVFLAVALRIFFEALFVGYTWFFGMDKHPHYAKIRFALFAVLLLLIFSSLWNPPVALRLLGVDDVELLTPVQPDAASTIQSIVYEDLKDVRIVSQEYASQLPRTELVETGYTVAGRYGTVDVYPADGGLRWISVYEPTVFLKKGQPSPYYVEINAMNPGDRQKVAASVKYSERDFFWSFLASKGQVLSTKLRLRLYHPGLLFGDGYYVPEEKGWVYPYGVIDYEILPLTTIYRQLGVAFLDGETGKVTIHKFGTVPANLQQYLLLEEYFAEERLGVWAAYHKWDGVLSYHFSQPEIFEPAEDLFFQYDEADNNFYALLQFEPRGSQRKSIVSWAEVAANGPNQGEITMYDARDLGLIGPVKATSIIESEVSQYSKAGFDWIVFQPQFKFIKGRYVYVAPIYAGQGVRITIKAIGVVDAKTEQVKILFWGDIIEGVADAAQPTGSGAAGNATSAATGQVDTAECELIYTAGEKNIYACPQ